LHLPREGQHGCGIRHYEQENVSGIPTLNRSAATAGSRSPLSGWSRGQSLGKPSQFVTGEVTIAALLQVTLDTLGRVSARIADRIDGANILDRSATSRFAA
jgi:hypothetical protein